MDKSQFSEFSYGYCLTEDLIVGKGTALTAAPVFPSLIDEGKPGMGYDLQLNRPGIPLFLQFKLVEQMVRGTANEAKKGHFQPPFYRMHLRPSKISDQHQSLISLEQAGNEVFYVAPGFHTIGDLNANYGKRRVWDRSFRVSPSSIGPLPNDKHHHVTFKSTSGNWKFYSEDPSREGIAPDTVQIAASLEKKIVERGKRNLFEQIKELDSGLQKLVHQRNPFRAERERTDLDDLGINIDPVRRIAYLARQYFGCQLLFVTHR